MQDTPRHTWTFPSKGLKALFDHEISGQLSDGAWENTMPYHHWKFWSHLNTEAGDSWKFEFNPFVSMECRHPRKKTAYNLSTLVDKEIVDLSPRMRAYYVDGEYNLGLGRHAEFMLKGDRPGTRDEVFGLLSKLVGGSWVERTEKLMAFDYWSEFEERYNAYTRDKLIADLRIIKKIGRAHV